MSERRAGIVISSSVNEDHATKKRREHYVPRFYLNL